MTQEGPRPPSSSVDVTGTAGSAIKAPSQASVNPMKGCNLCGFKGTLASLPCFNCSWVSRDEDGDPRLEWQAQVVDAWPRLSQPEIVEAQRYLSHNAIGMAKEKAEKLLRR